MANIEFISVPIHRDITTYEERIYGGVTARQVVCYGAALAIAVLSAYLLVIVCGFDASVAAYPIILLSVPIALVATLKPEGLNLETYLGLACTFFFFNQRLAFRSRSALGRSYHGQHDVVLPTVPEEITPTEDEVTQGSDSD